MISKETKEKFENDKENSSYYCQIINPVLYSKNLTMGAKLLYGIINSIRKSTGIVYASNEYFAYVMCVSVGSINNWLSELEIEGFIERDTQQKQTGRSRRIYVNDTKPMLMNER